MVKRAMAGAFGLTRFDLAVARAELHPVTASAQTGRGGRISRAQHDLLFAARAPEQAPAPPLSLGVMGGDIVISAGLALVGGLHGRQVAP